MRKRTICRLLALLMVMAFVFISLPNITAQELPKATKYKDVTWYGVTYYKFKPGMAGDALNMIYQYFVPAGKASGYKVIHFDVAVGEWDHVAFFSLDGGPGDLGWEVSPIYEKFIQVLVKQQGMEKLQEIDNFESMIAYAKSELVMRRKIDE